MVMRDMGVSVSKHIFMHCDDKSVIAIISNPAFHERTKHIKVDCHITHQECEKGKITLLYVPSGAQLADFCEVLSKLSMFDPP